MRSRPGLVGLEVATRSWCRDLAGVQQVSAWRPVFLVPGRDIIFEVATWVAAREVTTWKNGVMT